MESSYQQQYSEWKRLGPNCHHGLLTDMEGLPQRVKGVGSVVKEIKNIIVISKTHIIGVSTFG